VNSSGRNSKPYGYVFDKETRTTTIFDRLWRPLVRVPGRFPNCGFAAAVACGDDEPRLYGVAGTSFLYHDDRAPVADPIVRVRLADLLENCPVLKEQVYRRREADEAAMLARLTHSQLVRHVFGEVAA
jgi:hypothetical protein